VLQLILSPTLGIVIDKRSITYALSTVGGYVRCEVTARYILTVLSRAQYTVACLAILLATFVPKGARAFNPQSLGGITTQAESEESEEERAKNTNPLPW
jgi:hypothetical protein